jgi:hypothetical protein
VRSSADRGLRSYLLLPRPKDLVKAWIFPVGFLLGVLSQGGIGAHGAARGLVAWFALELLLYQARYQWNDIRGARADQRHPNAAQRGRLPGPASRIRAHQAASAAVALARLAIAALLVLVLPRLELATPMAALAIGVFAIAAVYEAVRGRSAGGSARLPPPASPAIVVLWIVVGGGYAVRGLGGLLLGLDRNGDGGLVVAAAVCLWAFGIAFVTIRWALEALPFARAHAGVVEWDCDPAQERAHSLALARWLPRVVPTEAATNDGGLTSWTALAGRTALRAPWNAATLTAASAGGVAGGILAGETRPGTLAIMGAFGLVLALAVLARHSLRAAAWLLGSVGLLAAALAAGIPRPGLAALPWSLVLGVHLLFASQSADTLAHPVRTAIARAFRRRMRSTGPAGLGGGVA